MKEYADHWANMEDAHLLSRLRIGQMFVNMLFQYGYVRKEDAPGKDPFYMSDEEFVKSLRKYLNHEPVGEPQPKPKMKKLKRSEVKALQDVAIKVSDAVAKRKRRSIT